MFAKHSLLKATLVGAVASIGLTQAALAADYSWDMPTPYADAEFQTQNVRMFANDVKRLTDGQIDITVHSANSLIANPEIKRAVQLQQVPIAELFISNLSREDPIFEMDAIPFLASNYQDALKLYQVTKPVMQERLLEQGLRLLYAVPWPSQAFYTTKPVNSVADLKGLKMRAYNEQTSRLAEALGTIPTTVQAPEIPQAFSTGIIDTMFTSAQTGVTTKAWDYTKYYYDTQAWVPKNVVFINEKVYQELPDALKADLQEAAAIAETRGWMMSMASNIQKPIELAKNGMEVGVISPQFEKELKAIGDQMLAAWLEKAGEDGQKIIEQYKAISY